MSKSLVIEPMEVDDLNQVVEIEKNTASPWGREQISNELGQAGGWQFVVRQLPDNKIVGYICGRAIADEAEILKIAVTVAKRRQGVASALLRQAFQHMRKLGAKGCFLELRASNTPARQLYEKFGFTGTGIRKKYYKAPQEDALIMVKKIEEEVFC